MTSNGVAAAQRFAASNPCPVCGGHKDLPQRQGVRCYGYASADAAYAHCTREEYAGPIQQDSAGTYAHWMRGDCRCGRKHGEHYSASEPVAIYRYGDFEKGRFEKGGAKTFSWRKAGEPTWPKGATGARMNEMPLFGADSLAERPGEPVIEAEGEKAAGALQRRGFLAVSPPSGARQRDFGKALEVLRGRDVYIWPDNDDDGADHARHIAESLRGIARTVRLIAWIDAPAKGDAFDYFASGFTPEQVPALMAAADLLYGAQLPAATPGGDWVFDRPPPPTAIWGDEGRVLWRAGEPAMIYGPVGVGKTTVEQQIALGIIGVREGPLLGLSIPPRRHLLYLALDRPLQAVESMARMVTLADRVMLNGKLTVWDRGLPFDLGSEEPERLLNWCREICPDVDTVILDGLYLAAAELEKPAVAARVNLAFQALVREGVEILIGHHPKKMQAGAKPKSIDQMFGGVWLAAGMGSVMLLWGEGGDVIVEFSQLKQPRELVGPFKLIHDHERGVTTIQGEADPLEILRRHNGISAPGMAKEMFDTKRPTDNEIEKARRQLQRLVKANVAHVQSGHGGGTDGGTPSLYYAVTLRPAEAETAHETAHASQANESAHFLSERPRRPDEMNLEGAHGSAHGAHGDERPRNGPPFIREAVGAPVTDGERIRSLPVTSLAASA